MIARLALVAVALAVVVALARSASHHDACASASTQLFEISLGHVPAAREPAAVAKVRGNCRGTSGLVAAAGALSRQGRDRQAIALATEAARREPGNASVWVAVRNTAERQAPALARAAEARLRDLDPLAHPSLNRSIGRSTR